MEYKTREECDIAGEAIFTALNGFKTIQARSILKFAIERLDDVSIVIDSSINKPPEHQNINMTY